MPKKLLQLLILVLGLLGLGVTQSIWAAELPQPPVPVEKMRALAYTKEFAKRFNLPELPGNFSPSGGLEAIEFKVEKIDRLNTFICYWNIYINESVPFAFPGGANSGSLRMFNGHFFKQKPGPWPSHEDTAAYNLNSDALFRLIRFASSTYDEASKRGASHSSFLDEFVRNLVPGLSYLKTSGCSFSSWYQRGQKEIFIWLKIEGRPDYRVRFNPPGDFYKLAIPDGLLSQIMPWASWANEINPLIWEKMRQK